MHQAHREHSVGPCGCNCMAAAHPSTCSSCSLQPWKSHVFQGPSNFTLGESWGSISTRKDCRIPVVIGERMGASVSVMEEVKLNEKLCEAFTWLPLKADGTGGVGNQDAPRTKGDVSCYGFSGVVQSFFTGQGHGFKRFLSSLV